MVYVYVGIVATVFGLLLWWALWCQKESNTKIARARKIVTFAELLMQAEKDLACASAQRIKILQAIAKQSLSIFALIDHQPSIFKYASGETIGYFLPIECDAKTGSPIVDRDGEIVVVWPGIHPLIPDSPWGAHEILSAFAALVAPHLEAAKTVIAEAEKYSELLQTAMSQQPPP